MSSDAVFGPQSLHVTFVDRETERERGRSKFEIARRVTRSDVRVNDPLSRGGYGGFRLVF